MFESVYWLQVCFYSKNGIEKKEGKKKIEMDSILQITANFIFTMYVCGKDAFQGCGLQIIEESRVLPREGECKYKILFL